jgi:hypothetical protein
LPRKLVIGLYAAAAILAALFLARDVDFRVYWYGVTGFFGGTRPAYGLNSGIGFPMEYRYPPVTYLLIWPFRWLPLRAAGFCWMLAEWIMAGIALWLAVRVRGLRFNRHATIAVCAFLLAYVVLAVHYGNVQPFVIAWLFAAQILSETKPVIAGVLLALAITFKIWPIFFLVLLFRRERWHAAMATVVSLTLLWAAPAVVFGVNGYWTLLRDWYSAVGRVGTTYSELYYFPGQSLRGVLLRLLTPVEPAMSSFPRVNFLSLDPKTAVTIWMIVAPLVCAFFAIWMLRSPRRTMWIWDGLAFVLYSMFEPFAVKSGLISLAPAALTAASLYTIEKQRTANRLFLTACVISFLEAILQYRPWMRYLLAVGTDFWMEILLVVAFVFWLRTRGATQ